MLPLRLRVPDELPDEVLPLLEGDERVTNLAHLGHRDPRGRQRGLTP